MSDEWGDRRVACRVTAEKRERKGTLGRTSCRWEDNIKLELQKVGLRAWTGLICLRTGTGGGRL
jgi:hypothetical protein